LSSAGSRAIAIVAGALATAPAAAVHAGPVLLGRLELWDGAERRVSDASDLSFDPRSGGFFVCDASAAARKEAGGLVRIDGSGAARESFDLSSFTRKPAGVAFDSARNTLFLLDDDELALHEIGRDGRLIHSTDLAPLGAKDPEGIASDTARGRLFIADGRAQRVLIVSTAGAALGSIAFPDASFADAEGIAYDPRSGHLFVVEGREGGLFELDPEGALVGSHDLRSLGVVSPQGVALAPSSDPGDAPELQSLYIADELVSKQDDSRIVEIRIVSRPPGTRLLTSLVGDVDGFDLSGSEPGFAKADRDRDGRIEPGEVLPSSVAAGAPRPGRGLDEPPTDVRVGATEARPVVFEHALDLRGAEPLWARLTLVAADAMALRLARNSVLADGVLIGELAGTTGSRLEAAAVVETAIELPPLALARLRDGRLRIELARPPGGGDDELWIDFSRLDVAVAR